MHPAREVIAVRFVAGAALLARPRVVLTPLGGRPPDRAAILYARVLGVRHLIEATLLVRQPSPLVLRAGAAIDAIHAASAFALAETDHHRRLATVNTASAAAFAAAGVATARR